MKYALLLVLIACSTITSGQAVLLRDDTPNEPVDSYKPETGQPKVYSFAEVMPQYPGGDSMMKEFIKSHLQYPAMERDNHIQGKVLVQYVVDTTGAVTNVKLIRSVSPGLDLEAVRIVKQFPIHAPGKMQGRLVAVYQHVPVVFKL
jgi:TonB family protein